MAEDLYSILGVARDAAPEAIKKAYRKIAKENHPDVKPNDKVAEERFKKATAAFEVLSDARKRKLYDEFGEDAARIGWDEAKADQLRAYRAAQSGRGGGSPYGAGAADFDLGEIFGDIFGRAGGGAGAGGTPFEELFGGGARRAAGPQRGEDLTARMTISLSEAVRGTERSLQVRRPGRCATCQGSGRAGAPTTCPTCNGSGKARRGRGLASFGGPCPTCGGSGTVAPACAACGGSGTVEESQRITVRIPAGVQTGSQVRLAGQGAAGLRGGPPGDLYIEVEVQPHALVRREGDDLFMDLPVTVPEAVDGSEVRVPTFEGGVTVRVPPGSQSGRKLRLRGRGAPSLKGGERGDLYLVLQVRVPEPDGPGVRQAVEQLREAYPRDVRADLQL